MTTLLKQKALLLLRQGLNNPTADFREAQWEAIEVLLQERSHEQNLYFFFYLCSPTYRVLSQSE